MKKIITTLCLAALACGTTADARQLLDRKNNFFLQLPDHYLLEEQPTVESKNVAFEAYDPGDDSSFVVKIAPHSAAEIRGIALDEERSKLRASLQKMELEPYVEGIISIYPGHEGIYTFSRMDNGGETLNYLMAKFWAHYKEYTFICLQSTKTLKTQEFLDTVGSFICTYHNVGLPKLQQKERPLYDKAKDAHDYQLEQANAKAAALRKEGKDKEADELLKAIPQFKEVAPELMPLVEINGNKPLPVEITDRATQLYYLNSGDPLRKVTPEEFALQAKQEAEGSILAAGKTENSKTVVSSNPVSQVQKPEEKPDRNDIDWSMDLTPKPGNKITVIRGGQVSEEYIPPKAEVRTDTQPQERELTKAEKKQLEKAKKEQEKFEKEQAKLQAKLDKLRDKRLKAEREKLKKEQKK